jgi:hypothetical protein
MSDPDWLSLTEIAQLWSDETGESAEALERDLDTWFSEFVARESSQQLEAPGRDGDTTNLLMAMLGGRHLQRETFAVYCEERGHAKPRFWFAGNAEGREPPPPLPSDSSTGAAGQSPTGDTRGAGPAQRHYEEAWAEQAGFYFEPAQLAPETTNEASYPAARRPAPGAPAATPEPAGLTKARTGLSLVWRATGEAQRDATARLLIWVRALPLSVRGLLGPEATRIVGGLTLGLALLAVGFVLGQGEVEHPDTGPDVARPDEIQRALVSSLRSDLAGARGQIVGLDTALEASEKEVAWLTTDLLKAQQALDGAQETAQLEATVPAHESAPSAELAAAEAMSFKAALVDARRRIGDLELEAQTAKAEAGVLTAELTEVRQQYQTVPQDAADETQSSRQRLILAAEISSAQATLSKQDLIAALDRLARFESEAQAAKAEATILAGELAETRRLQSAALETAVAAADTSRHELILAAQAASAHAALLDQDLDAARQRIADLETALQTLEVKADRPKIEPKQTGQAQEVRDRNTIAPTQASPEHAASTAGNASIQTLSVADVGIRSMPPPMPPAPKPARSKNPVEGEGEGEGEVETEQQAAAEEAPVPSSTNDVAIAPSTSRDAADVAAAVRPQQTAAAEFIDADSLIADPNRYDTHRVVVTGSLLRLLQHYRLQSESGARTLIVDVAGIHRTQYEVLRDAIASAGLIGSVRAQISGEVVRGSAKKFHLVASDLVLVE